MDIEIHPHTLERALERGATQAEIEDVIRTGSEVPAKQGRSAKAKVYLYQQVRNDRFYEQKRVEVIYLVEDDTIITVTVYVFFGRWEEQA